MTETPGRPPDRSDRPARGDVLRALVYEADRDRRTVWREALEAADVVPVFPDTPDGNGAAVGVDVAIVPGRVDDESARLIRARLARLHPEPPIVFGGADAEPDAVAAMVAGLRWRRACAMAGSRFPEGLLTGDERLVGRSDAITALRRVIRDASATNSHVLITGETGTGKELTADLLHRNSPRGTAPLVSLNCAALPESLLESELFGYEKGAFTGAVSRQAGKLSAATGGTLFLDEVGELNPGAQAKLLRFLESRTFYPLGSSRQVTVDVRLIAATNEDLEHAVAEQRFRRDLFYRLNVVRVRLPPLRERKEDILPLCDSQIAELNPRFGRRVRGLTTDASMRLLDHDWPGNVRELRNVIEAAFVHAENPASEALELAAVVRERLLRPPGASERDLLLKALIQANWNKRRAAAELNWSRMTVYRKMALHRIARPDRRTRDGLHGHAANGSRPRIS